MHRGQLGHQLQFVNAQVFQDFDRAQEGDQFSVAHAMISWGE
jgi:hypothetical protein